MCEKYVGALDVGTSTIKCQIYNSRAEVIGKATENVKLYFPHPGFVEIVPDELWQSILAVIKNAINDAGISPSAITSVGLSTQRGTFVTWDSKSGEYFHNFITWKDMRADAIVNKWNKSLVNMCIFKGAYLLYAVSRKKRYLAASVISFTNTMIMPRFSWAVNNIPKLKQAIATGTAMFGTLDTWLLHKLTGSRIHVTDYSSASGTGMFDPFTKEWATWAMRYFGLPPEVLPVIIDTAGYFGEIDESLFGASIPITCSMADQSASMFGACCFNPGDVKLTMGTGSFININTGDKPHASILGLYPQVAWKVGGDWVYMVEGNNTDTGTLVLWAIATGLVVEAKDTADMAYAVNDTDGVFFIPAFAGLGPPVNDHSAGAGFIGVKMTTRKEHLVRSILESISFGAVELCRCTKNETSYTLSKLRIDGGVAQNDFVGQLISDMTGLTLERPSTSEISAQGCAFLAGIAAGIWDSKEEVAAFCTIEKTFTPREGNGQIYLGVMKRWEEAIKRFKGWYKKGKKTNLITPKVFFNKKKTIT